MCVCVEATYTPRACMVGFYDNSAQISQSNSLISSTFLRAIKCRLCEYENRKKYRLNEIKSIQKQAALMK